MADVSGVPYHSVGDLIGAGFGGYAGWADLEALYDYRATGGSGKQTTSSAPSVSTPTYEGPSPAEIEAKQKAEEQEFLGRFRSAVEGLEPVTAISERLSQELGLPGLRESAFGLTQSFREIPTTQQQIGEQVGISAPRLEARIAEKRGVLAPSVSRATEAAQFGERELGERLGLEVTQQQRALIPFEREAGMISDRLAREVSMWTTEREGHFSQVLASISAGTQLSIAELQRAADEARAEEDYLRQRELLKLQTDESIRQYLATRSSGGGSDFNFLSPPPTTSGGSIQDLYETYFGMA